MKVEADSSGTLHRDVSTDWAPEMVVVVVMGGYMNTLYSH